MPHFYFQKYLLLSHLLYASSFSICVAGEKMTEVLLDFKDKAYILQERIWQVHEWTYTRWNQMGIEEKDNYENRSELTKSTSIICLFL